VQFFDDLNGNRLMDPGEPIGSVQVEGLAQSNSTVVSVPWVASYPCLHEIYAWADWDDRIAEFDEGNNLRSETIELVCSLLPPRNLTVRMEGHDALLRWDPPPASGADFYIIHGGPSPTEIDFGSILGETADSATVQWRDVGRGSTNDEFYYVVRCVNRSSGARSSTTNTAGFFAIDLHLGLNTFSSLNRSASI